MRKLIYILPLAFAESAINQLGREGVINGTAEVLLAFMAPAVIFFMWRVAYANKRNKVNYILDIRRHLPYM